MGQIIKKYAEEFLTLQAVQNLVDNIKAEFPAVVEHCLQITNIGLIQKILKSLLRENVPIRDLPTILETISDVAEITKNIDLIVEEVRSKLSRVITKQYKNMNFTFLVFNFNTEQKLLNSLDDKNRPHELCLNTNQLTSLVRSISDKSGETNLTNNDSLVMVVNPLIRKSLSDIFEKLWFSYSSFKSRRD